MSTWIEVKAAYSRTYSNQKQIKADWKANLDFQDLASGSYVNKSDAERLDLKVTVRYGKNLTSVMSV